MYVYIYIYIYAFSSNYRSLLGTEPSGRFLTFRLKMEVLLLSETLSSLRNTRRWIKPEIPVMLEDNGGGHATAERNLRC